MNEFELIPDERGFFVDVQYPGEETPRYSIDLLKMICTCMGNTMGLECKHLKEVRARIRHAGVRLNRVKIKGWND